jgi:hypothetical protein
LSKITLSGNASGTGTFTIASPNSNSDRTVNLPDAGGDMVLTTATQTLTNKTFSGAQGFGTASLAEPTGAAPLYMCRAWVNFDGTTGPATIRASGNVSSVTKPGTGQYQVNFATALPDANYSTNVTGDHNVGTYITTAAAVRRGSVTTTSVRVDFNKDSGGYQDMEIASVVVFR